MCGPAVAAVIKTVVGTIATSMVSKLISGGGNKPRQQTASITRRPEQKVLDPTEKGAGQEEVLDKDKTEVGQTDVQKAASAREALSISKKFKPLTGETTNVGTPGGEKVAQQGGITGVGGL